MGSPPLTRGKAIDDYIEERSNRITPAYAGKSCLPKSPATQNRDHPRLRGEKCNYADPSMYESGSPPLTRGKGDKMRLLMFNHRITPAYAGKSPARAGLPPANGDHPRLRGEKNVRAAMRLKIPGSPPLTRGKEMRQL